MKRLLFCAGILALAASCTEDLDTLSVQQEQTKGITFTAIDSQNATTRGEFEEVGEGENVEWLPFWSAETDMIKVFATNVIKDKAGSATPFDVSLLDKNYASYKATRSERNAYFTASNQIDILDFDDNVTANTPATFVAVYPNTIQLADAVTPNWEKGFDVKFNFPYALDASQIQTNTEGKGIYELNAKYAVATGYPEADNKVAVGENVPLKFNRVLSGLVFKTKGVDAYTDKNDNVFGKLQSITVKTLGEYKDGEAVTTNPQAATMLTYGGGSTITISVKADGTSAIKDKNFNDSGASNEVTLNLGLDWNDKARGYMIIKPVDRKVDGKSWNEGLAVSYKFANIEFTEIHETDNDWEVSKFIPVPALDINNYPWLVTKTTTYDATGLTLILNEGADFNKIYLSFASSTC